MKQFTFSLIALVITSLFVACKKYNAIEETPTPPANNLAGIWIGQYDYYNDNTHQVYFYSFDINANGSIKEIAYTGEVAGEGTWKLNGNNFTATYKSTGAAGKIYSVKATYNASTKKLTGSWGKGDKTDTGDWNMTKK